MDSFKYSLIDGDVLLYQVCRGCERDDDFGDIHVLYSDFNEAKEVFKKRLEEINDTLRVPMYCIFFSGTRNWRKDVMSSYKNHRKDVRKPLAFARLRGWITENYTCKIEDRLEADDLLGLYQRPSSIVVSIDKDMSTVPGWFAHIRMSGEIEISRTSENAARFSHMIQAFMGDRVDGYPGCTGVGIKTAEKILNKVVQVPGEMTKQEWLPAWNQVVYNYEKQGQTVEDAHENFMVSKILTNQQEYDGTNVYITMPTGVTFIV